MASIERLVAFLMEQGVNGLALFGNASEGYALTTGEKQAILTRVKQMVGDLPVVAAAGGASPMAAIEDIKRVTDLGATVAMVNPPSVIKPSPEAAQEFFGLVVEGTDIDIMIQDAPLMTGVNLPVPTLVNICKASERVKYIKVEQPPTTLKITLLMEALENSATLFGGLNAGFLFEELERGAIGTMPACEFPDVINNILGQYFNGNREGARETFYRYLPFLRYGVQPNIGVSIHKEVLHASGIFATNHVRNPARYIDNVTRRELFDILEILPLSIMRKSS
ncbi:dihydrodipicolinate synthase family protein [Halomonas dongshanensis]|nr:dihydrodipicolinate synthase family protein [Halomonas dongshanensis]